MRGLIFLNPLMVHFKNIQVHLEKNLIDLLVGTGRDLSFLNPIIMEKDKSRPVLFKIRLLYERTGRDLSLRVA
jgi:hypothetical protein